MTFKPSFEIVKTTTGAISIRDNLSGEILHNPIGPWNEARSLYVEQSRLMNLLKTEGENPVILYDVGLGAGFNALAAIELAHKLDNAGLLKRKLSVYSFEIDLTLFKFAIENIGFFPESLPYKKLLQELDLDLTTASPSIDWRLCGAFEPLEKLEIPPAHIIFFDPYSPKTNPKMWTVEVFKSLREKMSPEGGILLTYSTSTRIRAAMALGGLYVGHGASTGEKRETSAASLHLKDLMNPLGERWVKRWLASHDPIPLGETALKREDILAQFKEHPQFKVHLQNHN